MSEFTPIKIKWWVVSIFFWILFLFYTGAVFMAGSSMPWHIASYTNKPTIDKYYNDQADDKYSKEIKEAIKKNGKHKKKKKRGK